MYVILYIPFAASVNSLTGTVLYRDIHMFFETEKLIYKKDTLHHSVRVYERGSIRTLRLGDGIHAGKQTQIDLENPNRFLLEYTHLMFAGLLFNPNPQTILIIGLGGGVIPKRLRKYFPTVDIDVVDIDPEVLKVARDYFFFKPDERLKVHIADGRLFILQTLESSPGKLYDMIMIDAFQSDNTPPHLTSVEFLKQLKSVLHPKGVVVTNVLTGSRIFNPQLKTYQKVFGSTHVFVGKTAKNAIIVSPGPDIPDLTPDNLHRIASLLQDRHHYSFNLNQIVRRYRPHTKPKRGTKVLTDRMRRS